MKNRVTKTFYNNDTWTCPAGVTNVNIIPRIKKTNFLAASNFSLFSPSNNCLYAWGNNLYGQLGDNTSTQRSSPVSVVGNYKFQIIKTALGSSNAYSLGLTSDGVAYGWGGASSGTAALGTNQTYNRSSPTAVSEDIFLKT